MKTQPFLIMLVISASLISCRKEDITSKISASNVSNYATDGTLAVQVSILPPATPQTFLSNVPYVQGESGTTSTAVFQLTSTKHIIIETRYFQVSPDIISIDGWPSNGSLVIDNWITGVNAGGAIVDSVKIVYKNVDAYTSGTIPTVRLSSIYYHTPDYDFSNYLTVDSASGTPMPVCLVNNIAHIKFVDPPGYITIKKWMHIATIELTGDTAWTLNELPLKSYNPNGSYDLPEKLEARFKGTVVGVDSGSYGIHFTGGFKHNARHTERIRIFGYKAIKYLPESVITEMGNLSGLEWKDGLGTLIPGTLNSQFYKEQTGGSYLYHPCCAINN